MITALIAARPISLDSGADSRNYHLAHYLSQKYKVNIYVPSMKDNPSEKNDLTLLQRIKCVLLGRIPYVERLKTMTLTTKELAELERADVIQLEEMAMYYVMEKYLNKLHGKIILDTHNIDYIRFLSETNNKGFVEKYIGKFLAMKLKNMEIAASKKVDHILVCSSNEEKYFSHYISAKKITVIPNGANSYTTKTSINPTPGKILFMGLLSYAPNAIGLRYYIDNIHPRVLNEQPNAQLIILGKEAPEWLKELAKNDKSIKLEGFVKDVREYIISAVSCICPIFSGSGTRLKILEYMALGKPVVSTTIGAEGIKIKDGYNILLADSPEEFAKKIIFTLTQPVAAKQIGEQAKKLIDEYYTWDTISTKLLSLYRQFENK